MAIVVSVWFASVQSCIEVIGLREVHLLVRQPVEGLRGHSPLAERTLQV